MDQKKLEAMLAQQLAEDKALAKELGFGDDDDDEDMKYIKKAMAK